MDWIYLKYHHSLILYSWLWVYEYENFVYRHREPFRTAEYVCSFSFQSPEGSFSNDLSQTYSTRGVQNVPLEGHKCFWGWALEYLERSLQGFDFANHIFGDKKWRHNWLIECSDFNGSKSIWKKTSQLSCFNLWNDMHNICLVLVSC